MKNLRLSFIFLLVAFFCVANSNPLLGFFSKRSEDKVEEGELNDKAAITIPSTPKSGSETATTTTTATPSSDSSCGGLKNFLHICNKNEPTETPKSIKTRSVSKEDSDESSDESKSDDDDDDDDSDESLSKKEKKQEITETSSVVSESTEGGIAKRQVGDPGAPVLGEVPPVISDAELPAKPIENPEEEKEKEKRQVDDSNSSSNSDEDKTEEILQRSRRRRDCTDRNGYYGKDCRRKRELVPSCFDWGCKKRLNK